MTNTPNNATPNNATTQNAQQNATAKKRATVYDVLSKDEIARRREIIKCLVRTKYDFQNIRISTANRLEKKKDGSEQDKADGKKAALDLKTIPDIVDLLDETASVEKDFDKRILHYLKGIPVWEQFLKNVKGCGPAMAAIIISEIDIEKATSETKIWQYAGLNPNPVRGHKMIDGKVTLVDDMVKGDKPTAGYIIPYNKFLKAKLLGVLADCMIKSKSGYKAYYDNYKQRLSNSSKEFKPGRVWKNESKAHIANASRRYMIKMFLHDLYVNWRTLEGLDVRVPYVEEYLGHKTTQAPVVNG